MLLLLVKKVAPLEPDKTDWGSFYKQVAPLEQSAVSANSSMIERRANQKEKLTETTLIVELRMVILKWNSEINFQSKI